MRALFVVVVASVAGAEEAATGRLLVDSKPKASVAVDGVARGTTPLALDAVPVGSHTLVLTDVVSKRAKTVTVEVRRDDTTIHLERLPVVVPLSNGNHVVQFVRDDKPGVSTTIEVDVQSSGIVVSTSPVPTAAAEKASGRLTLKTEPWTEVYEDGRLIGETPLVERPLSAGRHTLLLRNVMHDIARTIEVDIAADQKVIKSVRF
ncbi:MAG: PEGA domain-containing protein [Archangium sp.]|nr:PEGA domain-containing protein [Archangium sp.]